MQLIVIDLNGILFEKLASLFLFVCLFDFSKSCCRQYPRIQSCSDLLVLDLHLFGKKHFLFVFSASTKTNHSTVKCATSVWTNVFKGNTSADQILGMMSAVSAWRSVGKLT